MTPRPNPVPDTDRLVAGVMSGTSLDGIDVALVRLAGTGRDLRWSVAGHRSRPFPAVMADTLRAMADDVYVSVDDLTRMHVRLAHEYADAIQATLVEAGTDTTELALVGCHGQTIRHLPAPADCAGRTIRATLQLGSGPTLATRLGTPVVSDFRAADMAAGGEGAPLVPYADWALLSDAVEHRAALNIGGIANVTVLPAGAGPDQVAAFDTGPGNMVSDALCRRLLDCPYDEGGRIARSGSVDDVLLTELMRHPFLERTPPRSTGREEFGAGFVDAVLRRGTERGAQAADLVATAAALTADTVTGALERFVLPTVALSRILVSGGGLHNRAILDRMASRLSGVRFESTAGLGVDPDAKEAVAFAVLAHETEQRVPTGMPRVTGSEHATVQGSVSYPA